MKYPALTIRQPFATLISLGYKTYEVRTWRPPFKPPFSFMVHAGATPLQTIRSYLSLMPEAAIFLAENGYANPIDLPRSAFLGMAHIDEINVWHFLHPDTQHKEVGSNPFGGYGWHISRFIETARITGIKGKLGFWLSPDVPDEIFFPPFRPMEIIP